MPNRWIVTCPENHLLFPLELWRVWQELSCVAVGWPPECDFHLEGETLQWQPTLAASEQLRHWLRQVAPGDTVVPFLMNNRLGTPGEVTEVRVSDAQWEPTVPQGWLGLNPDFQEIGPTNHPTLDRRRIRWRGCINTSTGTASARRNNKEGFPTTQGRPFSAPNGDYNKP